MSRKEEKVDIVHSFTRLEYSREACRLTPPVKFSIARPKPLTPSYTVWRMDWRTEHLCSDNAAQVLRYDISVTATGEGSGVLRALPLTCLIPPKNQPALAPSFPTDA